MAKIMCEANRHGGRGYEVGHDHHPADHEACELIERMFAALVMVATLLPV